MAKRKSKRKAQSKSKPQARRQLADKAEDVVYLEYEITEEPIHPREYRRLPESVKDRLDSLHYDAQSKRAKEAVEELVVLKHKYPKVTVIYNYLTSAYAYAGDMEKAIETALECMQVNPDYLFARLNCIEFYLRAERYDEIPALVDHKFDLKLLYPKRKTFHISEYTSFMSIIGLYFAKIGERDRAKYYLDGLQQVAPKSRRTKALKRELHPNLLQRFIRRGVSSQSAASTDQE